MDLVPTVATDASGGSFLTQATSFLTGVANAAAPVITALNSGGSPRTPAVVTQSTVPKWVLPVSIGAGVLLLLALVIPALSSSGK